MRYIGNASTLSDCFVMRPCISTQSLKMESSIASSAADTLSPRASSSAESARGCGRWDASSSSEDAHSTTVAIIRMSFASAIEVSSPTSVDSSSVRMRARISPIGNDRTNSVWSERMSSTVHRSRPRCCARSAPRLVSSCAGAVFTGRRRSRRDFIERLVGCGPPRRARATRDATSSFRSSESGGGLFCACASGGFCTLGTPRWGCVSSDSGSLSLVVAGCWSSSPMPSPPKRLSTMSEKSERAACARQVWRDWFVGSTFEI
mmetsp:Transcript_26169/g.62179  ORF Transcript_26169/g.62179 Transcript_26169/m.62179 type:complete len:262 (-) Transcript_26169:443-1228(-)